MTPDAALADVAGIGPFFAVLPTAGPGWPTLSELLTGPLLAGQVARTAAALGGGRPVEPRVATSVAQLGLAARLLSPPLAVAVLHGLVLRLDPDRVRWRPGVGGPVPLAVPTTAVTTATPTAADPAAGPTPVGPAGARLFVSEVVVPLVGPLVDRAAPLARGLLWGNTASALAGATATIAAARPTRAPAARAFLAALLAVPPLGGTLAPDLRRRSCCLLYRAGSPLCGDCALRG